MELYREDPANRVYLDRRGEFFEVQPMLRGITGEMNANVAEIPVVHDTATRMLTELLVRRIEQEGGEVIGEVQIHEDTFEHMIYLADDDGNLLLDDDGAYIVDPEFPDPILILRTTAEVGYWPPAPTEGES